MKCLSVKFSKNISVCFAMASMAFLFCGCGNQAEAQTQPVQELMGYRTATSMVSAEEPPVKSETFEVRKGNFIYPQENRLFSEQETLIRAYMERYYSSLKALELQDFSDLFLQGADEQVLLNESAVSYVIGLRAMQDTDLRLQDYDYEMEVTEVKQAGEGQWEIFLTETSTQNFMQHPDIDTELFHIRHYFLLEQTEDGLRVAEHLQRDGIYRRMMGNYWDWETKEASVPQPETYYPECLSDLLEQAETGKEQREAPITAHTLSAEFPYDRAAAVQYSRRFIGQRNPEWSDFTGRGGNCQNFVSQCLLAGGIPMDRQGASCWFWDGEGHTASWVGVDEFYRYVAENSGYGLAALADAPYDSGEPGDLIRMGEEGDWNHVVIIAQVVKDEQGNTADYLINSNTSDVRNFPVSAYPNPLQKLTKIYGWND